MSSLTMISVVMFFLTLLNLVAANCVTLINYGPQAREICWFLPVHPPPYDWKPIRTPVIGANGGRWTQCGIPGGDGFAILAINAGTGLTDCVKPLVRAEITFQGRDNGETWYDLSAIADNHANNGIHKLYPTHGGGEVCVCDVFPCNNHCVYLCKDCATNSGPANTWVTDLTVEMWAA